MNMLYINLWYNEVFYKGTPLYMVKPLVKSTKLYKLNKCYYFSTKTYVVSTQKNRLNERVLLST